MSSIATFPPCTANFEGLIDHAPAAFAVFGAPKSLLICRMSLFLADLREVQSACCLSLLLRAFALFAFLLLAVFF
eukprot:m.480656 g.480656  ORF g.480656 m.480656 type:complete len:75 (-) comp57178_c0_seq4:64-288(-)